MIPLVMSVIAKTETFQRDMAKAGASVNKFSTTSSRTTATVMKLGRSLMMMAGVGGGLYMLQRGLRGAVREASRAQETMGKFNVVFGENAKEASRWAEEFGNSVGRSTTDIQEWMASVQDLFVPLGFARKEATGLSESLVSLAVDVASFSNKVDADVIRDFTSALVGNHETVRKYGIMISENSIKQEALNQGINKSYKELTDLEKVSLRMALIQKGSTDAQGDAVRTSDNYANQIKRINAEYQELSVTMGNAIIPALTTMLVAVNENSDAWKDFFRVQAEGWAEVLSGFESTKTVLKGYLAPIGPSGSSGPTADRLYSLSDDKRKSAMDVYRQHLQDAAQSRMQPGYRATQNDWREDLALLNKIIAAYERSGKIQAGIRKQTAKQTTTAKPFIGPMQEIQVQRTADELKAEAVTTKAQITSIQAMYDKTRMEKIRMLEDYRMVHFGHTKEIETAEQLLNDEILSLQRSRVDALVVYNAELKEDMQDSALYAKEKFAEAAQSIEGSMSGAFQSMIQGGANFRDAMNQFFIDIGASFAKMAADMAARAAMNAILNSVVSGIAGGIGGGFNPAVQAGSPNYSPNLSTTGPTNAGVPSVLHSGWVPYGTPSFQRGRGLKSSEMVAVIEKDELLAPNKQVVKSGLGGGAGLTPESLKIVIVRNEREAQIEFGNSPAGEKVWIRHATRNRNLMR